MTTYADRVTHSKPRGYLGRGDVHAVIEHAAWAFGVTVDDLTGPDRRHPLVDYRQIAMAAARAITGESYPTLGRAFDRDHSTVISGVRRMADDPRTAELVRSYGADTAQGRLAL